MAHPRERVSAWPVVDDDEALADHSQDEASYHSLATLVCSQHPTGARAHLPADLDAGHEVAGLTTDFNASRPFHSSLPDLTADERGRLMHWPFGPDEVTVSKAIRIPVTYQRTVDGVVQESCGSIVIGYNGPGPI